MKVLDGIRTTGKQKLRITAENGDLIEITLYFMAAIQKWKMDIVSPNFILNGYLVYNSLNLTCQYDNLISYGIACIVSDGGEPFLLTDFSSKRCELAILSPDEVIEVQNFYVAQRAL